MPTSLFGERSLMKMLFLFNHIRKKKINTHKVFSIWFDLLFLDYLKFVFELKTRLLKFIKCFMSIFR